MLNDRAVEAFSVETACITAPWYPQVGPHDAVYWADRGPGAMCPYGEASPGPADKHKPFSEHPICRKLSVGSHALYPFGEHGA